MKKLIILAGLLYLLTAFAQDSLQRDPMREIPPPGAPPLELLPQSIDEFNKYLVFKSDMDLIPGYGRSLTHRLDHGNTYQDKPSWRIMSPTDQIINLMTVEPFKVTPGERVFISLRIFVERGYASLVVLPWRNGVLETTPFATGAHEPGRYDDNNVWVSINAYLTIPEGVQGLVPVISIPTAATYNIAEWRISRPSEEELKPTSRKVEGFAYNKERVEEKLDRGVVALRKGRDVYMSWRLLMTDKQGVGFDVYRITPDGKEKKLNKAPIVKTTDYLDKNVPVHTDFRWSVRVANSAEKSDPVAASEKPYISIPMKNATSFASIGVGDLDGDGKLDFVVKTPNASVDPWNQSWMKSPGTYILQAYKSDGTFMWEYDLGWGIEQGIWYSPFIVGDFDGCGSAEIAVKTSSGDPRSATGRVFSGPEYLSILDGKTGKERARIDWPRLEGIHYSWTNRNQICLAYLDGKTPCIIALRGTYTRMRANAYQMLTGPDRLEELWVWNNSWDESRWGKGGHTMHAVCLDGDGRDEIVLGTIVLDDDGSVLWEWEREEGRPRSDVDHVYVGDIDPDRPGLEVVLGIEPPQPQNGICMLDAKTGKLIWGVNHPTFHIHGAGMVSPIDAANAGCLIWSGEESSADERWLRNSKGEILEIPEGFPRGLSHNSVWWTADLHRKLIINSSPVNFPSMDRVDATQFEGRIVLIGDLFGDWREEVVTTVEGEIRIYSTSIPARDRRTTFLQDPNYRATLTENSMGYSQIPLPSRDLKK